MNQRKGAIALDIGNTKTHGQIRGINHELLDEWAVPTKQHDSLTQVIEQGFMRAQKVLGSKPNIIGIGFGGPVDSETGAVKLAFVPEFEDIVTLETIRGVVGNVPVVHLNDVAASAHSLVSPYFKLQSTVLTSDAVFETGPSALVEIGTGVGTAYCFPDGDVKPSEAHRSHASNGVPHGLNLSGDHGFVGIVRQLQTQGVKIPANVQAAIDQGQPIGPVVTQLISTQSPDSFTRAAQDLYAGYLGEYLGMIQLCFLATAIYIGGSVGRSPMFLEHIIGSEAFWTAFSKEDALRGKDMPILRVDDKDATVKGVYTAALRQLDTTTEET